MREKWCFKLENQETPAEATIIRRDGTVLHYELFNITWRFKVDLNFFFLFCVWISTHNTSTAPKWESAELALSLHNVDRRDGTLAIRLGDKCFYPLSHLSSWINSVWRQDSLCGPNSICLSLKSCDYRDAITTPGSIWLYIISVQQTTLHGYSSANTTATVGHGGICL